MLSSGGSLTGTSFVMSPWAPVPVVAGVVGPKRAMAAVVERDAACEMEAAAVGEGEEKSEV